MSTAQHSIFPSLSQASPYSELPLAYVGRYVMEHLYAAICLRFCHVKYLFHSGTGHNILRNPNYGNEMEELGLNTKLDNISVQTRHLVKKHNRGAVWIDFFQNTEDQKENTAYTEPKKIKTVPFFFEYTLIKFLSWFQSVTVT
jgi:hypothetical protein